MNYLFVCNSCGHRFENVDRIGFMYSDCILCGGLMTAKQPSKAPYFMIRGQYLITGKNKIDSGIPFGEVPGDQQYIDSQGRKPGDKDYIGPLP